MLKCMKKKKIVTLRLIFMQQLVKLGRYYKKQYNKKNN